MPRRGPNGARSRAAAPHDRGTKRPTNRPEGRCHAVSEAPRHATRAAGPIPCPTPAPGLDRAVDDWTRLRRFLVLGSEHGSYHASEWAPTRANAQALERCIRADGPRAVAEIVRVSDAGRAPRNDPALFGLAMAAGLGDADTRRAALDALPRVARTASHLFRFAAFVDGFRGWGRSLRRAVGRWYAAQPVEALAYQAVTHRRREGVAHRDLLRRAHPARRVSAGNPTLAVTPGHERLFDWIVRGGTCDGLPRLVEGFVRAQASASPAETARLVAEYRLPARRSAPTTSAPRRSGRRCSTTCRWRRCSATSRR